MKVFRIIEFGFVIILFVLHVGCAPVKPAFSFKDPAFSLDSLKNDPCVLMGSPAYISLYDFKKTYEKVYHTNENFMSQIVDSLASELRRNGWNTISDNSSGVYDKFMNDSGRYISPNKAKYIICIRTASIGEINRNPAAPMMTPVIVTTGNKACYVTLEIVIMRIEDKKLMVSFSRRSSAGVNLFAYDQALSLATSRARRYMLDVLTGNRR